MSDAERARSEESSSELLQPAGESATAGLSFRDQSGQIQHVAAPPVVAELRYAVAKLHMQKGGVPSRLGITSAVSGEGVSFISRSLAAVIAHDLQRSVCLIDANWWGRPAPNQDGPGIADVVSGRLSLSEAIRPTNDPKLALLPAGSLSADERSRLARSESLHRVIDELAGRYNHILVDLPAVLVASEAITLADNLERCLFVVQQGVTPTGMVRTALDHLSGVQVLGVVMNRASTPVPGPILRRLLFS